jgi:hypothetical protein
MAVFILIVPTDAAGTYIDGPVISEFVASKSTGLSDQFGMKEDLIELHNPTALPVDLGDWYLTDSAGNLTKWKFPAVTLPPSGYLVVFASDRNLKNPANPMHTNFKLSAGGEYLALVMPDGVTVSWDYAPAFPPQLTDISYGVTAVTDEEGETVAKEAYYTVPTPGAANSSSTLGVLQEVGFSFDRGYFNAPFALELTSENSAAQIRYTLDGSAPTATTGLVYGQPIPISTTSTVRAAAYLSGYTTMGPETRTYLYLPDIIDQPQSITGWPRPSISVGEGSRTHDYEMDPEIVDNPVYHDDLIAGMTSIPTLSLVVKQSGMWNSSGNGGFYRSTTGLKEAASVEFINPLNPSENVQADCSVEGHSHDRMKRSLRLGFSSAYGEKKFDSTMFTGVPFFGDAGNREVDKIVLRAGNNRSFARSWNPKRSTYAEDEWLRSTHIEMGNAGSPGRFVHLFINGLYWGLYNAVQRPDADFAAGALGGEKEDWFSVSHGGDQGGDSTRWDYLTGALTNKNMSVSANYEELKEHVDVAGLIDYVLCGFYSGLNDWPQNNWWGANRNEPEDGPFQFFVWDGEWTFGVGNGSNLTAWVHPSFRGSGNINAPASRIWLAARANTDFLMLAADRLHKHLSPGGALETTRVVERWEDLHDIIRDPVIAESARWGDVMQSTPSRRDVEWQDEVDRIRNIMQTGTVNGSGSTDNGAILRAAMRAEGYYPSIDPPVMSQYGGGIPEAFELTLSHPNGSGSIYYTVNGTDPRLPGGALSPSAILYTGSVEIGYSLTVKSRVRQSSTWSALTKSSFVSEGSTPLRVTEIMYNPGDPSPGEIAAGFTDNEMFEFLEFTNIGDQPFDLTGAHFTKGLTFVFGEKLLAPGGTVLLVKNAEAFAFRYGSIPIDGVYAGNLDNAGEQLRLRSASDEILFELTYEPDWHPETDNGGKSLVVVDVNAPLSAWETSAGWRPSTRAGGSPGAADPEETAYELWLLAHFDEEERNDAETSGPDADPDHDGTANIVEFVCGTDPRVPQWSSAAASGGMLLTRGLPTVSPGDLPGTWQAVFARRKPDQLGGVTVVPQFSAALDDWSGATGEPEVLADDGDVEILTLPFPAGDPAPRFFRLKVELD